MYQEQTGIAVVSHHSSWCSDHFQMFTGNYERIPAGAFFPHTHDTNVDQERHRLFLVQCKIRLQPPGRSAIFLLSTSASVNTCVIGQEVQPVGVGTRTHECRLS